MTATYPQGRNVFPTFEAAEKACDALGLTPFRIALKDGSGQVQSVETGGPSTYGHPLFLGFVR